MSILNKIKESAARIFKKKNKQEEIVPYEFAVDFSEQDEFISYGLHNALGLSEDNVKELIELGKLEPVRNKPSRRIKKATHIYNSTKNKRIKNKQLKIINDKELI